MVLDAPIDVADRPLADQCAYERGLIDDVLGPGWQAHVVVFGVGQIGRDVLRGLRRMGIEPLGFSDNAARHWGRTIDGLRIIQPSAIVTTWADARIVVAAWRSKPILEQLAGFGLERCVPFKALFWHRPDLFLPYMRLDLPSRMLRASAVIDQVAGALDDVRSKTEFASQVDWLGSFESYELRQVADEQYFAFDLFAPRADDVFVDCGAYDGDTARQVLERWPPGVVVHALEPDAGNRAALESWRAGLPPAVMDAVHTHPYASTDRRCSLRFASAGEGSTLADEGDQTVEGITLDELFAQTRTTIIKMDIEGAEMDALRGASMVLRRDRPIVVACLYHRQEHLWEIPALLLSANPEYRLFIRRYGDEFGDVVCYAIPPHRLLRPC